MIQVPVELGDRRYEIHIGPGALQEAPRLLSFLRGRRIVAVSNARVWSLHGARVEAALRPLGRLSLALIEDGEAHKSWATLRSLCDAFLRAGLGRDGLVAAVGGGVVGDVAGFAAATYMRGVDWIQVPTTLLAMVDSSIGGKVAINHERAKNLVGSFHQPRAVLSDCDLLKTLPAREIQSGAYELLKCAILSDRSLFRALERGAGDLRGWAAAELAAAIAAACRVKSAIVAKDEREAGLRRVLNLGHTLGHALEAVTHYRRFSHGEAVGHGLVAAAYLARRRGLLAPRAAARIATSVDRLGPRPKLGSLSAERVLAAIGRDKKARAGTVPFILPVAIGRVTIRSDVTGAEVRSLLQLLARREKRGAAARSRTTR